MVELRCAIVSARSVPGMSVTQVPSRVRGLGMLVMRLGAGGNDQERDERTERDHGA